MQSDLALVSDLVRRRSGLVLTEDKGYLIESRLGPLVRKRGFGSISEMLAAVRAKNDDALAWAITEAMTTNETFFFRDKTPFDQFESDILPALLAQKRRGERLRIWSAACSSGQEAYSLAMILDKHAGSFNGVTPEIIGTDICAKVLEKAKAGLYSQFEVQRGLPVRLLVEYFEKQEDTWRIKPKLQQYVRFQKFNLLDDFAKLPRFDVIFCRNVLIYFDKATKSDVLSRMARQCSEGAHLVLGSAETVLGVTDAFENVPHMRGLYQRPLRNAA